MMHIESLDQMRRHLEAGGFLTLDGQGRLETQGAVARFFQKIGDAFRSLSASGRAAMAERDAAVSRAVDEMIRRDALVNPGRMEIPRPAGRAAAAAAARLQVMEEVRAMAAEELEGLCPQLDGKERALCEERVFERMHGFLYDADLSGGIDMEVLRGMVSDVAKNVVKDGVRPLSSGNSSDKKAPVETGSSVSSPVSGESSPDPAPDAAAPSSSLVQAEYVETELYDMTTRYLGWNFPRLSEEERFQVALAVNQDMAENTLPSLRGEDGTVPRKMLQQSAADTAERLVARLMPDRLATGLHPAPQGRTRDVTDLSSGNIAPEAILRQGKNTCFMLSVVNSLMTTEQGRGMLRRNMTSDGLLRLPGENVWDGTIQHEQLSRLEHSMGAAYKGHDALWNYGSMGLAGNFAELFGMVAVPYRMQGGEEKYQERLSGGGDDIAIISRHLNNGRMVILFENGHYMTVVGTEEGGLILRNSLTGKQERRSVGSLADSLIDVFAYPQE